MNWVTDVVKLALPFAGGPKLLEAHHIVGRQDIAEGRERNVGNLRDLGSRLAGRERRPVEAAAREAETELVDRRSASAFQLCSATTLSARVSVLPM